MSSIEISPRLPWTGLLLNNVFGQPRPSRPNIVTVSRPSDEDDDEALVDLLNGHKRLQNQNACKQPASGICSEKKRLKCSPRPAEMVGAIVAEDIPRQNLSPSRSSSILACSKHRWRKSWRIEEFCHECDSIAMALASTSELVSGSSPWPSNAGVQGPSNTEVVSSPEFSEEPRH